MYFSVPYTLKPLYVLTVLPFMIIVKVYPVTKNIVSTFTVVYSIHLVLLSLQYLPADNFPANIYMNCIPCLK